MDQNTEDLARKLVDCFNQNDQNGFDAIVDSKVNYRDITWNGVDKDFDVFTAREADYIKAFPNKKTKIDSILCTEDQAVVRWTTTGTQKGEYQGVAPTNKEITISGISIWRFENNKLVEAWQIWDRCGLLEQLGVTHEAHAQK